MATLFWCEEGTFHEQKIKAVWTSQTAFKRKFAEKVLTAASELRGSSPTWISRIKKRADTTGRGSNELGTIAFVGNGNAILSKRIGGKQLDGGRRPCCDNIGTRNRRTTQDDRCGIWSIRIDAGIARG